MATLPMISTHRSIEHLTVMLTRSERSTPSRIYSLLERNIKSLLKKATPAVIIMRMKDVYWEFATFQSPFGKSPCLRKRQHQCVLSTQICSLFQDPPSPSVTGITCLMLCHCCGFRIDKHFLLNKKYQMRNWMRNMPLLRAFYKNQSSLKCHPHGPASLDY